MCIVSSWPDWFKELYGGEWPRTYACFDTETTGFDMKADVIVQIGHVLVVDGKVEDKLELVLDWTGHPLVRDGWLRERLSRVKRQMGDVGLPYHLDYEKLKAEGTDPVEVLRFYRELFETFHENQVPIVSHNGYVFDEPMFDHHLIGFKIDENGFAFGDNDMIDTLGLEKATLNPTNPRMMPKTGDNLRSYFHRTSHVRITGSASARIAACCARYDLFRRFNFSADDLHGALQDSYCLHLIMEEYRRMITEGRRGIPANSTAPPHPSTVTGPKRVRGQLAY